MIAHFLVRVIQEIRINNPRMKENSIAPSVTGLFGGNFHTIAPAIITSPVPTASPAKGLLLSFLRYNDFVDTVLILTVILAGFAAVLYALHRWTAPPPPDNTIAAWLSTVQSSLDNSARLMSDVQKSLGGMSEGGRAANRHLPLTSKNTLPIYPENIFYPKKGLWISL